MTFNPDLGNPKAWATPAKILDREEIVSVPKMEAGWYPQVMGTDKASRETDKGAGQSARLFVHGKSVWEILFRRPGEMSK